MRLCFISDVHCKQNKVTVPECDILISCGDYSFKGEKHVVKDYHKWLNKQQAKHIVSINGNHELWVEQDFYAAKAIAVEQCPRVHFIQGELVEIEGLKIYGDAHTPYFFNWAWNAARDPVEASHTFKPLIKDIWDKIPNETQILVTHGPPMGILDTVIEQHTGRYIHVGCKDLLNKVDTLPNLKVHGFGHLHLSGGKLYQRDDGKIFINAAICDDSYKPTRSPVVIDI
jgi:Icc-related predicted phosphoesterase